MYDTTTNPPVATGDGTGDTPEFAPGEWIIVTQDPSIYRNSEAEVVGCLSDSGAYLVRFDSGFTNWFAPSQIKALNLWPANATLAEMREVVRRLNNDLTEEKERSESRLQRIQQAEDRLTEQQRRYRHDMQHWETVLREQKDEQDWCDEGTNEVIDALNRGFIGGWEIERYSQIVEAEVTVEGKVIKTITVHVKDGDDAEDPDNWVDEDGDEIDAEETVHRALAEEYRRNGWDEWEVK